MGTTLFIIDTLELMITQKRRKVKSSLCQDKECRLVLTMRVWSLAIDGLMTLLNVLP